MRFLTIFLLSLVLTSPLVYQQVYAATSVAAVFDVDGNNETKPLSDGLLMLRYLFGFRGDSLINKAIGKGATRTAAIDIETYLNDHLSQLDIDGNGEVKPLSDGLLLLRYLFGFRGESLINGAIGNGAKRTTATAIEIQIKNTPDLIKLTSLYIAENSVSLREDGTRELFVLGRHDNGASNNRTTEVRDGAINNPPLLK